MARDRANRQFCGPMLQLLLENGPVLDALKLGALLLLLGCACWSDLRANRIPNVLVAAGLCAGVLLSAGLEPIAPMRGVKPALFGAAVAFGCFFPLYVLRAMGAGDVKLMAAVGSFFDPWSALLVVLAVLLAGGLVSAGIAMRHGVAQAAIASVARVLAGSPRSASGGQLLAGAADIPTVGAHKVPYAVAIAIGTSAVAVGGLAA